MSLLPPSIKMLLNSLFPRNFNALIRDNPLFVVGIFIISIPLFFNKLIFLTEEFLEVKIIVSIFLAVFAKLQLIGNLRFVSITNLEGENLFNPDNLQVKDGLSFKTVFIPKFDKSIDDRLKKNKWQKIKRPPHLVIFEGWCVGARHQKKSDLKKPLNFVEKKSDPNLTWRKTVNNSLKNQYRKIFNKIDKLVYLTAPNLKHILELRWLQE